ncbi:MAG: TIGR03435 family protein [Vicinamibacterales bacterium]
MHAVIVGVVVVSAGVTLAGQIATQSSRSFEVASVKSSPPEVPGETLRITPGAFLPGGRFVATNAQLLTLIRRAYPDFALRPDQIDGPSAFLEQRFDVEARASGNATYDEMTAMLRHLLATRFRLKTRIERRRGDAYELSVVRRGSLGRGIRPPAQPCRPATGPREGAAPPTLPTVVEMPCGYGSHTIDGVRTITLRDRPIVQLITVLQNALGRPVIDRTGLAGTFDIDLRWRVDDGLRVTDDRVSHEPSLAKALDEQLGLHLRVAKTEVDVLVIDHVERPTPN